MTAKPAWAALAVLAAVLQAGSALGGEIYVDVNNGSCVSGPGQPDPYAVVYCAIQDAIYDAASGDTVSVAAGTYDGPLDIAGFAGLTINGADKNTVTFAPTSTLAWPVYGAARQAAIRVVGSTDVILSNMTMDFAGATGNNHAGILYWDSTGQINNNIVQNMSLPDASGYYYELTAYLRAPGYTDAARASITVAGNEFIDTGRVGLCTHQYVDVTVADNTFYKTTDDFGYAMELGSESVATVSGNTIYGYDTPAASDGSSSAGIFVENSFTGTTPAMTKNMAIDGNEIYDCQYALWIGNGWDGYAGPVALVADVSGNNLHDNVEGAVILQDEDASAGSSVNATFQGNTVTANGQVGYFIYTMGDGHITATLTDETITGHDVGVYLNDYAGGPSGSSYAVTVSQSTLTDNASYGVQNEYTGTIINAPRNWWGSRDGPQDTDSGTEEINMWTCSDYTMAQRLNAIGESSGALGNNVSDNVDYCEWYECLTSVECSDGLWCTGDELCRQHACLLHPRDCSDGWCDEAYDECRDYGDGDFDEDDDVDLADFADFQQCFADIAEPGCYPGNMTGGDGTIDLDDYAEFYTVLGGP